MTPPLPAPGEAPALPGFHRLARELGSPGAWDAKAQGRAEALAPARPDG